MGSVFSLTLFSLPISDLHDSGIVDDLHSSVMQIWIIEFGFRKMGGFEVSMMIEQRKDEHLTGISLVHESRK